MRILPTLLVTYLCFFHGVIIHAAGNSDWQSSYSCTATEEMPPPDKYPVKITFLKIRSEISVTAKSTEKNLNFQFGNGKLSGENTSDKSSYNCSNKISQSDSFYS